MSRLQSILNQKAEVEFRRKLVTQHLGKKTFFKGQPDKKMIIEEIKKRIEETRKDFQIIRDKNIPLSPFLEIGAERCQRALYLTNELGLTGFAADISFESLKSADYFSKVLNYQKMPIRICLDAYNLPFKSNSLPFIFFYETLHHFPDPKPILDEAYRVLTPGGYIFFAEEPIKQLLNFRLFKRDFCLTPVEKLLKYLLILPFISTIGKSEIESGILEEAFWLNTWQKSLTKYSLAEARVKPYLIGKEQLIEKVATTKNWLNPDWLTKILLIIQGGGISVLAKKAGKKNIHKKDLSSLLSCPECKTDSKLFFANSFKDSLICQRCLSKFKQKDDIFLLISRKKEQYLYPKVSQKIS